MNYQINSILLNDNLNKYKIKEESQNILKDLSRINILIGSNNSGKSKFMRSIFSDENLKFNSDSPKLEEYNKQVSHHFQRVELIITSHGATDVDGIIKKTKDIDAIKYLEEQTDYIKPLKNIANELKNANVLITPMSFIGSHSGIDKKAITQMMNEEGEQLSILIDDINKERFIKKYKFKRIYIPTLRGLRPLSNTDKTESIVDNYKERTIRDYFDENHGVNVFTGQTLYNDVLQLLCGDFKSRNHLKEFEEFLGESFFEGKKVSLIPKIGADVIYVKIGEEKEQPIFNLGDGIQSIIILTFQLFANKGEDVILFIEEPELYLHPGLQRKLVETFLRDEFSTFQYYITTHSNHMLDLTLDIDDISIYKFYKSMENNNDSTSFEKEANFTIENVSSGDNSVLQLLGVNNSSIFLSNCTIWVEGITDRFYLRKYFELYQNSLPKDKIKYKEDIHYSFVEYGGANITHWSFLEDNEEDIYKNINVDRICNKIFLITDKDGDSKQSRKDQLEQKLGDKYYCIDCREIENLLSKEIVIKIIEKYESVTDGEVDLNTNFVWKDYKDKYLGRFIDDNIVKVRKRKGPYSAKSGTVSAKVDFCKKAIKCIDTYPEYTYENLTDITKDLCKKIYNFIEMNNK